MPTLHVRNVPDSLHCALRDRARDRKSSISKETIRLLTRALRSDRRGVVQLLDEIDSGRPVASRGTPAAAILIRVYGDGERERLAFIRAAQAIGLALDDIGTLVGLRDGARPRPRAGAQKVRSGRSAYRFFFA